MGAGAIDTTNLLEDFAEDNVYGDAPLWYHMRETGQIKRRGGAAIQIDTTTIYAGGKVSLISCILG